LEALFNIIFYLWNRESLPWLENLSEVQGDISKHVFTLRNQNYLQYCKKIQADLPRTLQPAYEYVMSLHYDQKPDYSYILKLFLEAQEEMNHSLIQEVREGNSDTFDQQEFCKGDPIRHCSSIQLKEDLFLLDVKRSMEKNQELPAARNHYKKVEAEILSKAIQHITSSFYKLEA